MGDNALWVGVTVWFLVVAGFIFVVMYIALTEEDGAATTTQCTQESQ